ncbi:hypothetical protein Fot_53486 [Forsythia ovata]|uniref:Uncharacterized protein n=1 Tax=Forsythia ovata TaxID=205694 RepID=A0ABD1PIU8_9LAMI
MTRFCSSQMGFKVPFYIANDHSMPPEIETSLEVSSAQNDLIQLVRQRVLNEAIISSSKWRHQACPKKFWAKNSDLGEKSNSGSSRANTLVMSALEGMPLRLERSISCDTFFRSKGNFQRYM